MRSLLCAVLLVCLVAATLVTAQGQGGEASKAQAATRQGGDATKVLAATRQALGGEDKLAAVKNFVATGRTRQVRGNNLVPIEFEIACELPDKYVRRDEIPAQETGVTSAGFNGEGLVQIPPPQQPAQPATAPPQPATAPPQPATPPAQPAVSPAGNTARAPATATVGKPDVAAPGAAGAPSGRAGGPAAAPVDPRKARVTSLKQDFVRLTLGMFAASFSSYPLTFTLDGVAEAPQGKADIVEVKGSGTFAVKLFINEETHLPVMVSWTVAAMPNLVVVPAGQPAPENLPAGSIRVDVPTPPPATAPKEDLAKYKQEVQDLRMKALKSAPAPKPVEHRIYYADYRDIGNGIKFPFRLRRAIAGETVEETNFDNFKINGRIDARKFEVVK